LHAAAPKASQVGAGAGKQVKVKLEQHPQVEAGAGPQRASGAGATSVNGPRFEAQKHYAERLDLMRQLASNVRRDESMDRRKKEGWLLQLTEEIEVAETLISRSAGGAAMGDGGAGGSA